MIWWIVGGVAAALLVVMWFRTTGKEDRRTVSWWAGRNGYRYTAGTPELLAHLPGAPFDRGSSQELHDVLSGPIAGRPGLIVQFSWFRVGGGPDGLRSGICSAAVLELPAPVPELVVRKESGLGRDLLLESEEFNAAFRVDGAHDRFSYDVLNPRVMEWLLANQGFSLRLGGNTLAVWRDGPLDGAMRLGELRDFAATLFGMIPGFVHTAGYPATPSPRISEIDDLGPTPVGTLHLMQHLTHRGHEVERYEHPRKLWGITETAVSVKISVPTIWPVLMIAARRIASERGRQPRFDDGVTSGDPRFDAVYLCGTPRPDFALKVLTRDFTDLLLDRPATRSACVIFQSEPLTPEDDGVPETIKRGGIWVSAVGELRDQALADSITELACDLIEALPDDVLTYHVGAPVDVPPDGRWGNELPGYLVQPSHRV
ncbi:hypothetical protein [Actinophytocola algeriensis]|uniref:Uncharacterized protein n=1 Tax=Actinophytocola algeriensis TaxID=1768010 RepID=A0A7W7VDU7_9PSEU|nr:hypothetical protein [Actinophytocola algeriensis]MBB4906568.1 hypothetical protein [Actinophytocola algeriensis]MBE1478049.1 hypothetical protein [Actinophytocola algeriensis]